MNSNELLIWAAGFFDGEGSIQTPGRKHLAVGAAQVRRAPLDVFEGLFGGAIYVHHRPNLRHSDAWRWFLTGRKAADALEAMLPYLILKKREAEWGIELGRLVPEYEGEGMSGHWSSRPRPEAEMARRMELASLIRAEHPRERLPQRL